MDDKNNSRCYKLKPLDTMNNIGLRMIRMILGHEPMNLNAMNSIGLRMT